MLHSKISMTSNGILCETDKGRVCLDPRGADSPGINFISHAHLDHTPSRKGGTFLSSHETRKIMSMRGFEMDRHMDYANEMKMFNSGHILGAKGLLFDDIFYTGDICIRDRGFLSKAEVPKCKILILECSFGTNEFIFPDITEIKRKANEMIAEFYARGIPVILMGNQLGKAQTLTEVFGHWQPLYLHDTVKKMNMLHKQLGIKSLREAMGHTEAEKEGLLKKRPWVMIAPMMSEKKQFIQDMKTRYGAITIGFSGWAKNTKYPIAKGDYLMPLSDHCDFNELVRVAKMSEAEKVYTFHGFECEFADHLNSIGIDAEPLRNGRWHTTGRAC